jgi:hypothetical protein
MFKFNIGLLVLLIICVVARLVRKLRGGRFLAPPQEIDAEAFIANPRLQSGLLRPSMRFVLVSRHTQSD